MRENSAGRSCLRKLQALIRRGVTPNDGMKRSSIGSWRREAHKLIGLCSRDALAFSQRETIQLICLQTEFHDLSGEEAEAEDMILRHIYPQGENLVSRLRLNGTELVKEPAPDDANAAGLLRQVVWLHLEFAWVCSYRKGEFRAALNYLDEVKMFIDARLPATSYGTLSRFFYYQAHCYRGLRKFRESDHSLAQSQVNARLRYLLKIEESKPWNGTKGKENKAQRDAKEKEERTFAVICTARILGGGIAWNAIHRGQLTHAKNACLSAETLLEETGQEPYKLLVATNRLIAEQRMIPGDRPELETVLGDLEKKYSEHQITGSYHGQIRCALEIVQSRLDRLTYWRQDEGRRRADEKQIAAKLGELRETIRKGSGGRLKEWRSWRSWSAQARLLSVRFRLHESASGAWVAISDSVRQEIVAELKDLEHEVRGTYLEVKHAILRGRLEVAAFEHAEAVKYFQKALNSTDKEDPVLMSECFLQLADGYRLLGGFVPAREALDGWRAIMSAVDNAYLPQFAGMIRKSMDAAQRPFVINVEDDLTWKNCEGRLRSWLAGAARIRAAKENGNASGKAIAGILGIDPSSWSRWH